SGLLLGLEQVFEPGRGFHPVIPNPDPAVTSIGGLVNVPGPVVLGAHEGVPGLTHQMVYRGRAGRGPSLISVIVIPTTILAHYLPPHSDEITTTVRALALNAGGL